MFIDNKLHNKLQLAMVIRRKRRRAAAAALSFALSLVSSYSAAFSQPPPTTSCLATRAATTTALFTSFQEYLEQRRRDEAAAAESTSAGAPGVDPLTLQLAAATAAAAEAQVATDAVQGYTSAVSSNDAINSVAPPNAAPSTTPLHEQHNIGRLLLQRAVQTQLYYLADLRDEPTYKWLRSFLDHDHLDDRGDFNELDGIHVEGGWRTYLPKLEDAPPLTITVQLAPPKLSAQQRRNPYLAAQAAANSSGRSYEETIDPRKISGTIQAVARSLGREWAHDLAELAMKDRIRVALHVDSNQYGDHGAVVPPKLQTKKDAERAFYFERQVVAGGEGDDHGTPLHKLNSRMVARFCTRAALRRVADELQHDNADGCESKRGAGRYLVEFTNEWVPKLNRGPDDDWRRRLGTPPPGQWQRLCDGADADDAMEALWQELPQSFVYDDDGREAFMGLYGPEALAARMRGARADVCDEVAEELQAIFSSEF